LPQQFPVEGEWEAQRERQSEHKLSDGDIGQDVIHEIQRPLAHASAEHSRIGGLASCKGWQAPTSCPSRAVGQTTICKAGIAVAPCESAIQGQEPAVRGTMLEAGRGRGYLLG